MTIELLANEHILREGMATRYSGNRLLWTGTLYLTNQRLTFVTHPLNFQRYSISVPLDTITDVELVYNFRFFPHGFHARLKNGELLHLSGWHRNQWVSAIKQAIAATATEASL